VPGIGPGLLAAIAPHLAFSGVPGPQAPSAALLDLNTATAADLELLPGIGAAKAQAIVSNRERHGSFSRVADLGRIPGFGPSAVARLSGLVRAQ
jgi:competence protein ComEA